MQQLTLRRLIARDSSAAHSCQTAAQLLRSIEGQLLTCCLATVEQLLVLRGTICGTILQRSHLAECVNVS